MRRSGRTTRIKNFIVEELFSVGGCVATDHTVFEHPELNTRTSLQHLIKQVEEAVFKKSNGTLEVTSRTHAIAGVNFIVFKATLKNK